MKRILILGIVILLATSAFAAERTMPEAKKKVPPVYTDAIRAKQLSGTVVVSFVVAEDGTVQEAKVSKSPSPELSEAAVACIRKWQFRPGTIDGKPVRTRMAMPIVFDAKG